MSHGLRRTSYNMMIYEVRDYCCSILDVGGRLLAQNTGGVSHFVADLGVVIRDGVARYGAGGFAPGDVVITNHQRVAGQHLNNIVVYTPCFGGGELVAFAATRAHWIDVGGLSTGFSAVNASDPWMEGLQLDQIKLWNAGALDDTACGSSATTSAPPRPRWRTCSRRWRRAGSLNGGSTRSSAATDRTSSSARSRWCSIRPRRAAARSSNGCRTASTKRSRSSADTRSMAISQWSSRRS